MTTLTIEQGNNTETVSNAIIQKLYNIASNSTNVTLAGNLQCECCYQYVYDYFTGNVAENVRRFPNLSLTVTNGRYINFADPEITKYWADSTYGDGVGLNANSVPSISTFPKRLTENGRSIHPDALYDGDISTPWLKNGCYAFYKDKSVTSFNELGLFSNITTIPTGMFRKSTLKYIDLSNITTIEAGAFAGADLTGIINLPKFKLWGSRSVSVSTSENISGSYFADNANMTEIHIGADVSDEDKITSVPASTFKGCSSLSKISELNMVTSIGDRAFLNCASLKCIDLTNIHLFGGYAFDGCSNLTALDTNDLDHINDNTEYTFSIDTLKEYTFRNTGLNGKTLNFTNINSIPTSAFEGSGLNKFIGTSITTTKNAVFKNCTQLLEVQLGNVTTIEEDVFNGCSSLATIKFGNLTNDFSNITSIGLNSFRGCSSLSLTNLSLPSLTSIGSHAFDGFTGIQSITDLGQITQLPNRCFSNCTNLTSVIIPGTVKSANINAFYNSGVLRIIVNEGCTEIFMGGFNSYNGSIRYIECPSTITSLGSSFGDETFSLNSDGTVIIVIKAVTPPTATKRFWSLNCYRKISKIYVPDDSVSAYLNSSDNIWGLEGSYFPRKIAPISQLLTDNPTYWAVYQSGLSNS